MSGVVLTFERFESNFIVNHEIVKYLKETCYLNADHYTGELGYDTLNGTRKIGLSYAKSYVYIWRICDIHWTGTKYIVRHMQKSVVQWSVISFRLFPNYALD